MSQSLLNNVPILDGSNFQVWAQQIVSYLRSQGIYKMLEKDCPEQGKDKDSPDVSAAIEKWEDANSKALGAISLTLHFLISYKHRGKTIANDLMEELTKEYGKPGVAGIFLEFKKLMDLKIPEQQDPSISLDQFIGHISCLHEQKVVLPAELQSLLLLSKIPSSMTYLVRAQKFILFKTFKYMLFIL